MTINMFEEVRMSKNYKMYTVSFLKFENVVAVGDSQVCHFKIKTFSLSPEVELTII